MTTHQDWTVPGSPCPFCGHLMDQAGSLSGSTGPRPHDVSVCIRCARFLEYDDHLKLIPLDPAVLKELPTETLNELRKISYAVLTIRSEAN